MQVGHVILLMPDPAGRWERALHNERRSDGRRVAGRVSAGALGCVLLCFSFHGNAAESDELSELKRAIEALREQNRALSNRVLVLEEEKGKGDERPQPAMAGSQQQTGAPGAAGGDAIRLKKTPSILSSDRVPTVDRGPTEYTELQDLRRRVDDLEAAKTAQEDATRFIIRDTLSKTGTKINQYITLGGALEMAVGRTRDFSGRGQSVLELTTAEFDFDIQVNDWTLSHFVIGYDRGTNVVFPTTTGFNTSVDRINLDQAFVRIGDTTRFPLFAKAGRMVLPFGISTGSAWADTLSTENPLTVEAFEIRKTAIGFGVAWPTPALQPATPPVVAPPVRPLVVNPAVNSMSRRLGYQPPPARVKPRDPVAFVVAPPLYDAGVYLYSGNPDMTPENRTSPGKHIIAHGGLHTRSDCGRRYDEMRAWDFCPRSLDLDLSFNTSLFDSRFLEDAYRPFLNQIGYVSGAAASLKSTLGPVLFVAEWNGAVETARFTDDSGRTVGIKPSAWQVSLGYQFDWNPWVQAIGEQGTYAALSYSQSRDLAGVQQSINNVPERVGFVPKRRVTLTGGEWVADGLRLALEYTYNWDYSRSVGGTGGNSYGVLTTLLYVW
jgi:hypothetical protein